MESPFDKFKEYTPEVAAQTQGNEGATDGANEGITQVAEGQTGQTGQSTTSSSGERQNTNSAGQQAQEAVKVDEFFTNLNTRFGTQIKTDDELKSIFELPKRVTEYEDRLKEFDSLKKSNDQYKQDLDDLRRGEAAKYLEDPIMQKAWVVKELKKKYPSSDVSVLTDLAMSDIDKMDSLDLLAREIKMKLPNRSLESIKSVILDEIGADTSVDPKEWDEKVQTKLDIRASAARENIKSLLGGIEPPKVETKEDYQKRIAEAEAKRAEVAKPYREKYQQFDKHPIMEGLDYTVPEEFKKGLSDMFDSFLKGAGEVTPDTYKTLEDIRDAAFYSQYRKQIYDTMYKDAMSKVKAEWDEKHGNSVPPNTATASDAAGTASTKPGHNQFMEDQRGQRITKFG